LFLVEASRYGPELENAIEAHRSTQLNPSTLPLQLKHVYVAIAAARLKAYEGASSEDRNARLRAFRNARKDLERAAGHPTLRCHAHILDARFARLRGKEVKAVESLAAAEELATATDNPWVLFEALRERALLPSTEATEVRQALEKARALAAQHGWASPGFRGDGAPEPAPLRSSMPPPA
jgi:hypothetical protein